MIIYICTSKILKTCVFKTCFSVHNIHLCWQVENTKLILCSQKTGVKCAYLRFLMYKIFLVPDPEPECRVDADCPSRMACLNEVCRNPCTALTPCGINAECSVQNTLPQRTMLCMCRRGYVGDADVACNLRKFFYISTNSSLLPKIPFAFCCCNY